MMALPWVMLDVRKAEILQGFAGDHRALLSRRIMDFHATFPKKYGKLLKLLAQLVVCMNMHLRITCSAHPQRAPIST